MDTDGFSPPFLFPLPLFFYETLLDLVVEDRIFHFVSSIAFFVCSFSTFFFPSLCLIRLEARSKGPRVCFSYPTLPTYLLNERACRKVSNDANCELQIT